MHVRWSTAGFLVRAVLLAYSTLAVGCAAKVDDQLAASTATLRDVREVPPEAVITAADGVNSLPGALSVSRTGAASYSIPLALPAPRAGMGPSLALSYSSDGSIDAMAGVGWKLDGPFSTIHRCRPTHAQDGYADAVRLTDTDPLCLDGQRLILTDGQHLRPGAVYRTEVESWQLIRMTHTGFVATGRDGRERTFGGGETSQLGAVESARGIPFAWHLSLVKDRTGNTMRVGYAAFDESAELPEVVPLSIAYTGHVSGTTPQRRVRFEYEKRSKPKFGF